MIIIKLINDHEAAKFVVFAQPVLLTIAIAIYSLSVSVHKIVERHDDDRDGVPQQESKEEMPPPLVIATKD
jgi:hypothetical protein